MNIRFYAIDNFPINRLLKSFFFPLGFLVISLTLDSLYLGINDLSLKQFYLNHLAYASANFINFITPGENVAVYQNSISSGKVNLEIARTCSGSTTLFLLMAAILVFYGSVWHKVSGIVFSVLLVSFLNHIRIVSLYFSLAYNPDFFSLIHLYIAPTLTIICCCLFFTWWAFWAIGSTHE
ncbi:exosortase family protein XrtM [Methylomonas methanica]|uniref:Exosortase family protein XrtF n=1 Tax=Methylomonas methanica (strain DSM 25384 / MC09) TaxID=857087 RepID=G0A3Z2_METMM|nr:exosortase family protein XrtM [Methylomonas methanica]AEG02764.1 hypothetical protein Metme_4421 [Methylomonas methanica MC09]